MKKIICDKCKKEEIIIKNVKGWFVSYFFDPETGQPGWPHPKASDLCADCAEKWFKAGFL